MPVLPCSRADQDLDGVVEGATVTLDLKVDIEKFADSPVAIDLNGVVMSADGGVRRRLSTKSPPFTQDDGKYMCSSEFDRYLDCLSSRFRVPNVVIAHTILLAVPFIDFYFDFQWGHTAVRAVGAWEAGVTGKGVRVCVLDEGFNLGNPDLSPNINLSLSRDMTGENGGGPPEYLLPDLWSHGSHTSGTIAAANSKFIVPAIVSASARSSYVANNTWPLLLFLPSFRWLRDDWSGS
jgi:subtilisin family serine protease